jgi:phosphopantetheine adenylyltransferase
MMPNESYAYLSSRLIKQAAFLGADVTPFIPKFVTYALRKKLKV